MEYKKVRKLYLKCEDCGKENERVRYRDEFDYTILCVTCYERRKKRPTNSIPPIGEVHYDENGDVVCHICGKSFKRLGSHVAQFHKIKLKEYKKIYKISSKARLTNKKSNDEIEVKDCQQLKMY